MLWERIEFTRSDKNKPVLLIPRSRQPYSFNISHHGDWYAIVETTQFMLFLRVVLVWHDSASVGVGRCYPKESTMISNHRLDGHQSSWYCNFS